MPLPPAPAKRADRLALEKITKSQTRERQAKPPAPSNRPIASSAAIADPDVRREVEQVPSGLQAGASIRYLPIAGSSSAKPVTTGQGQRKRSSGPAKLFVLDTNVLLHDPICLFRF